VSNYLAGINAAASIATSFTGPSSSAAISAGVAALGALGALTGGLGGFGGAAGTKPEALHTEFASGEANWEKPYGSNTDILFYMVRADKGAGSASFDSGISSPDGWAAAFKVDLGLGIAENAGPEGQGFFSAASQTGLSFPTDLQSPLSQVATFNTMDKIGVVTGTTQGLAGPLTGLGVNMETPLGSLSQTFSTIGSTASSVANITQSVGSLQAPRLGNASSTEFFQNVITQSFAPGAAIGSVTRTAEQISGAIANGSISDLSTAMSIASGGVTTSKQLIEGINKGLIGFTTQGSGAQANRLGPKGFSRERLLK
jgi:hypothetical protein